MADISQGIHGALRQAFLGSVVVSTVTSIGFNLAWPVLLPIGNNTGIEDLSFSQLDMQWLVSVRSLSGCLAPFLAGVFMEATGPTRQLLLCFVLTNLLWILMAIFPSKLILYAGRTALGVTVSMIGTIAITLTTELLPPGLRGVFGTLQRVASSIGILCVYVMASFLDWRWGTALCGVLAIPVAVLLFFVPESPYWLVKHGRHDEAVRSLASLRGPKNVAEELEDIKSGFFEQPSVSIKDQFILLKSSMNYRPVILASVTIFLMIMCGEYGITQYTVYLFKEADIEIDSYLCSILVGITYLFCNIVVSFFIDRVGRRPLLISTSFLCFTTLVMTSLWLKYDLKPRWVTLIFILLYVTGLGIGTGPLYNIMSGELVPTPVRSLGISFGVMISFVSTFAGSYYFPMMVSDFGMETTCLVFAVFNLLMALEAWAWLPETKGRTLVDLQVSLGHGKLSKRKRKRDRGESAEDRKEAKALQPDTQ